jgi:hypothetical protein
VPTRRAAVVACRRLIPLLIPALLFSCTIGEGEGPRYIGRVVSVDEHELCLGLNSSSPTRTCGSIPEGAKRLPSVGDCVSLFGHPVDHGTKILWSSSDLSRTVDVSECTESPSG